MQPVVPHFRRPRRYVIVTAVSGVAVLLAFAAGAPSSGFAQEAPRPVPAALGAVDGPAAADPSELFLRAFTSVQQAETAERDGKLKLAMSKYRFAATLLDQIGQSHPNWQPLIVGYRSRKTADSITKLQNKIEVQAAASVAPPALPVTPDFPPAASSAPLPPAAPSSSGSNRNPDSSNTGGGGGYFALPEADRAGDTGPAGGRPPVDPVPPETPRVSARAEAALNKAAQEARAKIDRLQDELKNTRKQLDAAQKEREKAQEERSTAQKEQTRLQEQLSETQGDLKTANKKAEDTKADRDILEIERQKLQARLKEAGATNAEASAAARKELGREVEKLNERLAKADEAAKTASRERDALAAKYVAAKSELPKEVTERLEKLAAENATLTQNRKTLEAEREKLQARLKEAGTKSTETAAAVRKEVEQLNERLAKADEAAKAASRERDTLAAKYAAATKKNPAGTKGELPKEITDRLEALAAENTALTQKLVVAEKTIADLNAEAVRRKEEAEAVQGELTKLRQQLAEARDKNDQADTQLVALRKQLDEGAERMKEGLPREEANKLAKENELLRNISLRLLKQQNVRAQASKLLGEELARLEIQSRNVTEQLSVLGQPTVQLTDEERALFKDPLVAISDNADPTTLAASIVAVNPVRPDGSPAAPTTASPPADGGNTPPMAAASPEANAASVAAGGAPPRPPSAETTPPPTPPVPEALVPLAKEAKENLDQGRFAEAEAAYEKLVARAPKSVYGLANLGVVLSRQGKLKSAETKLKKAVALAPNDPFSQATLGIVYYQMRRFDDAIECLTKAISLDPKTASAHNYLGITSFQKGWPEAAVEELDKALALRPDYADAHFNLAVVYALNQPPSKEKAQLHYKRATELGAAPDPALEKMIN